MKKELIYITDTYCLWCYGFSKAITQIAEEYAGKIKIHVVNGGMIPTDMPLRAMFARFPDPMGLHRRVEDMSGVRFGPSYLDEIQNFANSRRLLNSTTPAMAMLAFKHLGVKAELDLTHAIQHAYYVENRNLQQAEAYRQVAQRFGISFEQFKSQFAHTANLKGGISTEKRFVQQLGVQGFPALLLRKGDNRFASVAAGFLPHADLKFNLERALEKAAQEDQQMGAKCSLESGACG